MLTLETHFPTIVGVSKNPKHHLLEDRLTKKCFKLEKKIKPGGQDWVARNTYTTLGTYNLCSDPDFTDINKFVTEQVITYCKAQNIDLNCLDTTPVDAWINIYRKHDFQEYHVHDHSMISASYYLQCNDSSAKIYFRHPVIDIMSPQITAYNNLNYQRISFQPESGTILIFRSYLQHCVEQQRNDDLRICLSYNYRRKY